MANKTRILVCDDEAIYRAAIKMILEKEYEVYTASHSDEVLEILKKQSIDILLLDIKMRTEDEGLKLIPVLKKIDPDLVIVMSSGRIDFESVRTAMRLGAADFIPKGLGPDDIKLAIERVTDYRKILSRQKQQNAELIGCYQRDVFTGQSPAIIELRRIIEKVRMSSLNVVITGEPGVGKELIARQLRGKLADGTLAPFVTIDSSTIQSSTAESVLFGHERGAFTGADKAKKGLFEEANGGIIYFDEIGNMPTDIQAKLLRVLQEKEIVRLGSSRTLSLDFRVICATNRNLEEMVRSGHFRDDLLARMNVIPIHIPPLRERQEDIPLVVEHYLTRHSSFGKVFSLSPDASIALKQYHWPGNAREIQNIIAYVITMMEGTEIEVTDLPRKIQEVEVIAGDASTAASLPFDSTFYARVKQFEKELLVTEYARVGGNVLQLARELKMDRSHLYSKLKNHDIHPVKPDLE